MNNQSGFEIRPEQRQSWLSQFRAYRQVLEAFGPKPLILRTLDIGGDKVLPYMETPKEDNPFLGIRGVRFCLENPQVFRTQLRAAIRASVRSSRCCRESISALCSAERRRSESASAIASTACSWSRARDGRAARTSRVSAARAAASITSVSVYFFILLSVVGCFVGFGFLFTV